MKEQKRQNKIMLAWTFAWVASIAFLTGGVNSLWDSLLITKIGLLINLAIGIGMIIANKNLFRHMMSCKRKFNSRLWP